jgi:hypothetical protein
MKDIKLTEEQYELLREVFGLSGIQMRRDRMEYEKTGYQVASKEFEELNSSRIKLWNEIRRQFEE